MDHELEDPLEYYRAIVTALARLAAAHKSGRLDPHVDELFPFDPIFRGNEAARSFLHIFTNFLNLWQSRNFGASLDRVEEHGHAG